MFRLPFCSMGLWPVWTAANQNSVLLIFSGNITPTRERVSIASHVTHFQPITVQCFCFSLTYSSYCTQVTKDCLIQHITQHICPELCTGPTAMQCIYMSVTCSGLYVDSDEGSTFSYNLSGFILDCLHWSWDFSWTKWALAFVCFSFLVSAAYIFCFWLCVFD